MHIAVRLISPLLLIAVFWIAGCGKQQAPPSAISDEDKTMRKIIWLRKSSDELVSFCKCDDARISYPAQLDCPWCGCGWLFTCIKCRKAFTFAEGVEIEASWDELARLDITNRGFNVESDEDVAGWIADMKEILRNVQVGKQYVILDGHVLERMSKKTSFDGWFARHELDGVPHEQALRDPNVKATLLSSQKYWRTRELTERTR